MIDASVSLKWFFGEMPGEQDTETARAILPSIESKKAILVQPPHWVTEVL